jgi:hypothetical protein
MYQYRIFNRFGSLIRRIAFITGGVLAFFLATQMVLVFLLLHHFKPIYMYVAMALSAFALLVLAITLIRKNQARALTATGYVFTGDTSHADMKRYCRFLIDYAKRLATHRLLSDQQATHITQQCHDLSEAIHHHPLNDDLHRGILTAREQIIGPTFRYLDDIRDKLTESKARAAIQDLYQPPFPVIPSLVVFYHQLTLISEITDTYIPKPSLREYVRVILDVWEVMTKGDFLRYGQRLFSGLNANPHSLGRAGEDLGQAFSIIWLTHAVSRVATLRCCTLHDWDLRHTIRDMRGNITPCLAQTRNTLLNDALPMLKTRIRHYTPVDHNPAAFVEEISATFIKSVDAVVISLTATEKNAEAQQTSPGLVQGVDAPLPSIERSPTETARPNEDFSGRKLRRRRRHRRSTSKLGALIQRIVYLGKPPRH